MVIEKKQLKLFWLFLCLLSVWAFVPVWAGRPGVSYMPVPAMAVMLAVLLTRQNDRQIPKLFFAVYLLVCGVYFLFGLIDVFWPIIDFGSIVAAFIAPVSFFLWFFLWLESADKRRAYGLQGGKWRLAGLIIVLYVGLLLVRYILLACLGYGLGPLSEIFQNGGTITAFLVDLPLFFIAALIPYLGQEYGWRYFLQPALQKKFGLRRGVIVLGIIWGLWHLPRLLAEASQQWHMLLITQIISCIALGLFYAWAYLKTGNLWLTVILHYLNNTIVTFLPGIETTDELMAVSDLLILGLVNLLCFGWVIFSKQFNDHSRRLSDMPEHGDKIQV